MKSFFWIGIMAVLAVLKVEGQTGAVRLAIVTQGAGTAAAGDLLTAEFSKEKNVALLERDQIAKVLREQQLAAANGDYLKLGQLLGADGLLILEGSGDDTNRLMLARLVAVKPGVVIGETRAPWPKTREQESAKTLVSQFRPLLPKLAVQAGDAVPISVLNLRSAIRTTGDQSLEHELTLLLIHRLTSQKEVFVLERQHLDKALFEKELDASKESPFWTGRYLLDGTFDRDGNDPNRINVNARLTPPQGGSATPIKLTGSRTNLNALVESLTSQVLQAFKKKVDTSGWHPLDEAEQYYVEAQWALKWGLRAEAQAASESAWALGKRTKETAILRINSYAEGKSMVFWRRQGTSLVETPPVPDGSRVPGIMRTLDFFIEGSRQFAGTKDKPDVQWLTVGIQMVDFATSLLENYHSVAEARPGMEAQLVELRSTVRQAASLIQTNINYRPELMDYKPWWDYQWSWGNLWYEQPEDAFARMRELVDLNWSPASMPDVAVWSWDARKRLPQLKRRFIESVCASTNDYVRIKGLLLAANSEPDPPAGNPDERLREMVDALWEKREMLYDGRIDAALVRQIEVADRGPSSPAAAFVLKLRKDYLANATAYDPVVFDRFFHHPYRSTHTQKEADELPPLFDSFPKRLNLNAVAVAKVAQATKTYSYVGGQASSYPMEMSAKPALPGPAPVAELPGQNDFLEVPFVSLRVPGQTSARAACAGAQYQEGRVWFEMFSDVPERTAVFAAMKVDGGKLEFIRAPMENDFPAKSFVVMNDSLFTAVPGKMLRYRLSSHEWEKTEIPAQDSFTDLIGSGGRIYFSASASIFEYQPETHAIQTLVSSRRRESANAIERFRSTTNDFGTESSLFPGLGGTIKSISRDKIFSHAADAADWEESAFPRFCGTGLGYRIFPIAGSNSALLEITGSQVRARLLELRLDTGAVEPLLEHRFPADRRDIRADRALPPLRWNWPRKEGLHGSFQTADGDSLWVLTMRQWWSPTDYDPKLITLLRFERDFRAPMRIPVHLKLEDGRLSDTRNSALSVFQGRKYLSFFSTPAGLIIVEEQSGGYWLLPREALDKRLAAMRPIMQARADAEKQWQQAVLARFDANKNGRLEPDERAAMHMDAACLRHDLDDIDRDENQFLDVDEVLYFDTDKNGVIDQKEFAGVQAFDRILAESALAKYDTNHKGNLLPAEFTLFVGAGNKNNFSQSVRKTPDVAEVFNGTFETFDRDHNGSLDISEIAGYLDARFKALDWAAYDYKLALDETKGKASQ